MRKAKGIPMHERKYAWIPLNRIRVWKTANRHQVQFADAIRHITNVGLLKPIVVNEHSLQSVGYYELVSGESRLQAYAALKKKRIPAEVIDCDRRMARLISSTMTMVRPPSKPLTIQREIVRMKDCGVSLSRISELLGQSRSHIVDSIRLIESGDKRLIEGAKQGRFSVPFAIRVARCAQKNIRRALMDASDAGIIDWTIVDQIRQLMEQRTTKGKQSGRCEPRKAMTYTLHDVQRTIEEFHGGRKGSTSGASDKSFFVCDFPNYKYIGGQQ